MKFFEKVSAVHPAALLILIAALAFASGYWIKGESPGRQTVQAPNAVAEESGGGQSLYVCPMMDVRPMSAPGRCPVCGMELVKVSGGGNEGGPPRVSLTEREVEFAGIRVAAVERKAVSGEVKLYGQIEYDPVYVYDIQVSLPCVIRKVYIPPTYSGVEIAENTPLFDVYSSELFAAEQEFLKACGYTPNYEPYPDLSQKSSAPARREVPSAQGFNRLKTPAPASRDKALQQKSPEGKDTEKTNAFQKIMYIRSRLGVVDYPRNEIQNLLYTRTPLGVATVRAPKTGIIVKQNAVEGAVVNAGTSITSIANPRFVWAQLDVYESDYLWIKYDQNVEFETDAYPGEKFNGAVRTIYPSFDANKRAFKVGVVFMDPLRKLKPQMFIRAVVRSDLSVEDLAKPHRPDGFPVWDTTQKKGSPPLVIPLSAPLITGNRAVVYVQAPGKKGVYEGREIILGPRGKDCYIVREGLEEGELVVVNGNFKIDSAVQILAKPSMMQPNPGKPEAR